MTGLDTCADIMRLSPAEAAPMQESLDEWFGPRCSVLSRNIFLARICNASVSNFFYVRAAF